MIKDDCIFCKLANGVFPTYSLYEDDDFKVILDAEPSSKGHSLIIPKSHAKNLFELDDTLCQKALVVAKKVSAALVEELKCDGMNVLQNNGTAAGQTVFHYHIHLIPRYENDTVSITWNGSPIDKENAPSFAQKIESIIK